MAYSTTLARTGVFGGCVCGLQDGDQGRTTQAQVRGHGAAVVQEERGRGDRFQKAFSVRRDFPVFVGNWPLVTCILGLRMGKVEQAGLLVSSLEFRERFGKGLIAKTQAMTMWQPREEHSRSLIQEIEPLDVSLISKDVSADSTDAMKRTISGMLGLLPSDQFQVAIETFHAPLRRLLVSAMMTGYTLRNAEYRLCLQRNLDLTDDEAEITEELPNISTSSDMENGSEDSNMRIISRVTSEHMELYCDATNPVLEEVVEIELPEGLGSVSPEVAKYIQQLQAKLSGATQELDVCKRALTALEMGNIVCKQNDLLDYLRSLEPDKVAELSQPASSEVGNVIQQVIDGLMATLCQEKSPPKTLPFGSGTSSITSSWEHDGAPAELLSNLPLQFQSSSTVTRDYLARLLFWCMLLGHHMRGLEYRLELSRTLSLSGDIALGMDEGRPELN